MLYDEQFLNRLLAKVQFTKDGCWLWMAKKAGRGYGQLSRGKRGAGMVYAHRAMFEICVGPIPDGLTIDHLCRTPNCVNPSHMEPVTNRTNILRGNGASARNRVKTHCLRGHPFTEDNIYFDRGARLCRTCILEKRRRYYREHGEKVRARVLGYYHAHLSKAARSSRLT